LPVTLANGLTIFRILLIPVFMFFLLEMEDIAYSDVMAAGVFAAASLTDTLDGYFARSRDAVTTLGQFLDPVADKLLVSAALVSLVAIDRVSAWIAMVIISREIAVTGLRMVAAVERVVIPSSPLGKIKTFSQIIAIVALILPRFGYVLDQPLSWYLIMLATLITVISGIDYFVRARKYLQPKGPE
jgi:CDP-diacylglycerol--glycerol-3-phosphate 3-phosphatidyltransferase